MLFRPRGEYRWRNDRSSNALRMPSIQPQHSTTSRACAGVTDASREDFLWILIHTSGSASWCAASHVSNAASLSKVLMRRASGTTGAMTSMVHSRAFRVGPELPEGVKGAGERAQTDPSTES